MVLDYKIHTVLYLGSRSIANIEVIQRATSSGGKGQRFESSRARQSNYSTDSLIFVAASTASSPS
jgi:hypothetical protein